MQFWASCTKSVQGENVKYYLFGPAYSVYLEVSPIPVQVCGIASVAFVIGHLAAWVEGFHTIVAF